MISKTELLRAIDVLAQALAAGVHDTGASGTDQWLDAASAPIPQRTIRDAVRRGELTASRAGGRLLVRQSELDRWIEARRVRPATKAEPSAVIVAMGGRRPR